MRVMVMIKGTRRSADGVMPSEELLTEMGKYNEDLVKAGEMLAGEGLHPSSKGKRVLFSSGRKMVVDGPFGETRALIAGFWLWQVNSMEEAVEWVRRCPDPMPRKTVHKIAYTRLMASLVKRVLLYCYVQFVHTERITPFPQIPSQNILMHEILQV